MDTERLLQNKIHCPVGHVNTYVQFSEMIKNRGEGESGLVLMCNGCEDYWNLIPEVEFVEFEEVI